MRADEDAARRGRARRDPYSPDFFQGEPERSIDSGAPRAAQFSVFVDEYDDSSSRSISSHVDDLAARMSLRSQREVEDQLLPAPIGPAQIGLAPIVGTVAGSTRLGANSQRRPDRNSGWQVDRQDTLLSASRA